MKINRAHKILIAEDDPDDRLLLRLALKKAELDENLHFVHDGLQLLDFLYNRNKFSDPEHSPRPDIIFIDLNMPEVDGFKAIEIIKSDPNLRAIPIVVLSTSEHCEDILRSYNLGANSYITKRASFEGMEKVADILKKYWCSIVELPSEALL